MPALLLLLGGRAAAAAGLTGEVLDPAGAPLPGARVEASAAGLSRSTYTDPRGRFRFERLPAGRYELRVVLPRYPPLVERGVTVTEVAAPELRLQLPVPALPLVRVKVHEKAPLVSTTTSNVKEVYSDDFVYCCFGCERTRESLAHVITPRPGTWRARGLVSSYENPPVMRRDHPRSRFSLHTEGDAYAAVAATIQHDDLPWEDILRTQELVNHFRYAYAAPAEAPFATSFEVTACPWNSAARLVRVGVRARDGKPGVRVARDVKFEVRPAPGRVASYRLIGYEGCPEKRPDLDQPGEDLRAGQSVTALYEVVPARADGRGPLLTVTARWRAPDGWWPRVLEEDVFDGGATLAQASTDLRFAAAVAAFSLAMRPSPHRGSARCALALSLATGALGDDAGGERSAFVTLLRQACATADRRAGIIRR